MDNFEFASDKQIVFFDLDDVLFPEKDYLLQVYYLFAQFIEYSEQLNAQQLLDFMRTEYEQNGPDSVFSKTAAQFNIPQKYVENFDRLHQNARLPLKLLLFQKILDFLQSLVVDRKKIILLTDADPEMQLNKIRQTEWNGLEKYLQVFFTRELNLTKPEVIQNLLSTNSLTVNDALLVGAKKNDEEISKLLNLPYIESLKIYN
ncbi:HAD family hydrolase [Pedobacter sp. AW1-32]|uniref:HAD family hydrolase n=1 Tax=Pedobacter sp. AW1-32 TaxID=3383026 RepID=UPI003FEF03B0